jgi:hypothetical protein
MTWKDFYPAVVSTLALVVSGTAAYYSLFRVNVEAKAILSDRNNLDHSVSNGGVRWLDWVDELTLINNGNRPFAVTGIRLSIYSTKGLNENISDCRPFDKGGGVILAGTSLYPVEKSFRPTVVEGGKIVILPMKFSYQETPRRAGLSVERTGNGAGSSGPPVPPLLEAGLPSGLMRLTFCLEVALIDHKGAIQSIKKPVYFSERYAWGPEEGAGRGNHGRYAGKEPIDLSAVLSQ